MKTIHYAALASLLISSSPKTLCQRSLRKENLNTSGDTNEVNCDDCKKKISEKSP